MSASWFLPRPSCLQMVTSLCVLADLSSVDAQSVWCSVLFLWGHQSYWMRDHPLWSHLTYLFEDPCLQMLSHWWLGASTYELVGGGTSQSVHRGERSCLLVEACSTNNVQKYSHFPPKFSSMLPDTVNPDINLWMILMIQITHKTLSKLKKPFQEYSQPKTTVFESH